MLNAEKQIPLQQFAKTLLYMYISSASVSSLSQVI